MYMMMLVLNDNAHLDQILDAWSELGVSGTTILESTGRFRRPHKHIPMRYAYGDLSLQEIRNSTVFAMVPDEKTTSQCLGAVERIVGDLDGADTGMFCAWPLTVAKGEPARGQS